MWRIFPAIPLGVEIACKFIEIKRDPVRLVGRGGSLDEAGIEGEAPHQRKFARIVELVERRRGERGCPLRRIAWQLGDDLARVAEHRLGTSMAVLDIEHGIVAGLLNYFVQVEIKHGVVIAIQHHEANGILADFVHYFT